MNKLKFNDKYITILCERNDTETQRLASTIPYVHYNRTHTEFKTTIRNIDLVLRLFRSVDNLPPVIQELYDTEMQRRVMTSSLLELGPTGETSNEHITLRRHQQLAVELAEVNDKYAFYYDTRTGKTPLGLQIIKNDIEANPTHRWLILCPLILIENAWLLDAREMFPSLSIVNLHDKSKSARLKAFSQASNIYITNIESFITYREQVDGLNIHGCIVDESSTMKSTSSKFGKAAVDFSWETNRWYLLSGSPAPNGEHEYYRQMQSLDIYGVHQSYEQFKKYFFDNVSYNPQYEKLMVKPSMKAELLGLVKSYSIYVDKEDVLTTPGRDFIEVALTLPVELKKQYEEMKKELALELKEGFSILAASSAAAVNKLNQISSGFLIDTAALKYNKMLRKTKVARPVFKEETHLLSDFRFKELYKLLDGIGNTPVVIWCNYRKEFEIIKEHLGDKCACVYGATNNEEKNANIAAFKQGRIQYLICNPASADKGLTLTVAHHAIYFSLNYSYELWKQSMERIYGDVSKQPYRCIYYVMLATGTVDRVIHTTVTKKGSMSSAVLEHLKGGL